MKRVTLSVRQMEQLLANQQNRTLSNRWTLYHRDMVAGRFNFGLVPIVLYRDGSLADGQHRLRAAIEAGLPRTWYVVEIDRSEIVKVDAGRPRSTADHCSILGSKVCNTHLSAARMALWLEQEGWHHRPQHSHHDIIQALERYDVKKYPRHGKISGFAQLIGLCSFATGHGATADAVDEFYGRVMDGAMLEPNDPRFTLRNRLQNFISRRAGSGQQQEQLWLCVRAWNAYILGERLARLIVPAPFQSISVVLRTNQ